MSKKDKLDSIFGNNEVSSLVLSSLSQGLSIINSSKKFTYVNQAYADMLGYSIDEIIGRSPFDFTPAEEIVRLQKQEQLREKGETSQYEITLLHKNGSKLRVLLTGVPILKNNQFDGSVAIINDLTVMQKLQKEMTETSARLKTLISKLNSGILLEDQNRKILTTNEEFCSIFQIPLSPEELIGIDCSASAQESKHLVCKPDEFVERVEKIVAQKVFVSGDEIEFVDGTFFERDFIPIFKGKEYLGHLWEYRNITEKKKSELSLIKAKEEAEESRKMKQKFLANMSHEIRTPMNGVLGIIHLLKNTNLNDEQSNYLEILQDSSEYLLRIINDILDFSKIDEDKLLLFNKPVQLKSLIENTFETLRSQIGSKKIKTQLRGLEIFDEPLLTDPVRFKQIIFNLLSNAIKFTEEGEVEIFCEKIWDTEKSLRFRISVIDSGIGIPDEKKEHIFEAFEQAYDDTTHRFGGTGLGLNIVRELVLKMGGEIWLESEVGKGSTFIFELELQYSEKENETDIINPKESAKQDKPFIGKKILVADDNRINFVVANKLLEQWGAKSDHVEDGREALDAYIAGDYDLILMDMHMPVLDGLLATKKIRALGNSKSMIPIIAITAAAMEDEKNKCFEIGMNDYVSKPYNPEYFFSILSKYL